jgi:signal transduction histidine kinase
VRKRIYPARSPRALSACLLRAQDEERRRIARELHDSTAQTLALLTMNLDNLTGMAEGLSPEARTALSRCVQLAKQVCTELRTTSYLLHPPLLEEVGLASTVCWYVEGFKTLTSIDVNLRLSDKLTRLPADVEIAIFRIVQECLTNIRRHSGSAKAFISLERQAGQVVLEVKDEGRGIPQQLLSRIELGSSTGVGLRGMRERVRGLGGEFEIASLGTGTRIRAMIPLMNKGLAN